MLDNLALACFRCNRQKSDRLTHFDPVTSEEIPLFNPRRHEWNEHFIWSADARLIIGLTPVGRATIDRLKLNEERTINIRAGDFAVGRHPPAGDAIES